MHERKGWIFEIIVTSILFHPCMVSQCNDPALKGIAELFQSKTMSVKSTLREHANSKSDCCHNNPAHKHCYTPTLLVVNKCNNLRLLFLN